MTKYPSVSANNMDLEDKRELLHNYILMKLEERDYHAVADAAMDLRELEVTIRYEKK